MAVLQYTFTHKQYTEQHNSQNSNDTIGNRNRDLLDCSAVPHPTAPPHFVNSNYIQTQLKNSIILMVWKSRALIMKSSGCNNSAYRQHFLVCLNIEGANRFILKAVSHLTGLHSIITLNMNRHSKMSHTKIGQTVCPLTKALPAEPQHVHTPDVIKLTAETASREYALLLLQPSSSSSSFLCCNPY